MEIEWNAGIIISAIGAFAAVFGMVFAAITLYLSWLSRRESHKIRLDITPKWELRIFLDYRDMIPVKPLPGASSPQQEECCIVCAVAIHNSGHRTVEISGFYYLSKNEWIQCNLLRRTGPLFAPSIPVWVIHAGTTSRFVLECPKILERVENEEELREKEVFCIETECGKEFYITGGDELVKIYKIEARSGSSRGICIPGITRKNKN